MLKRIGKQRDIKVMVNNTSVVLGELSLKPSDGFCFV